jgi:hypothetical protein
MLLFWLSSACTAEGDSASDGLELTLAVNAYVGSVVDLTVSTERASTLSVEFGVGEERDHHVESATASTSHALHLYGLPYGNTIGVTATVTDANGVATTSTATVDTTGLPSDFPSFSTGGEVTAWSGAYAVMNTAGSADYAFILDAGGRVVWAWQVDLAPNEALMRARLAEDGETMLLIIAGRSEDTAPQSRLLRVPLYGGAEESLVWPFLDHDVVDLGDGALAGITRTLQDGLQGDAILERDANGSFRTVYSTWDDPQLGEPVANSPENTWTHMESLDWDPATDLFTFQTYLTDQFVRVRRSDGEPVLHLYGEGSDYAPADGETALHVAHQFEVLSPTRFLHFENGGRERSASRAVEFELDEVTMTYREVWSHMSDPPIYVYVKGDVKRFADGTTRVLWATAGRLEDVGPAGTVDWWLQLDLGAVFTYVQHVESLGPTPA